MRALQLVRAVAAQFLRFSLESPLLWLLLFRFLRFCCLTPHLPLFSFYFTFRCFYGSYFGRCCCCCCWQDCCCRCCLAFFWMQCAPPASHLASLSLLLLLWPSAVLSWGREWRLGRKTRVPARHFWLDVQSFCSFFSSADQFSVLLLFLWCPTSYRDFFDPPSFVQLLHIDSPSFSYILLYFFHIPSIR